MPYDSIYFLFIYFSGKRKAIRTETNYWLSETGSKVEVTTKDHEKLLEGKGKVLYIDYGVSHMTLFICQSSKNDIQKR